MRVPSTKETIAYFRSLGYLVKQVKRTDGIKVWKVEIPDDPLSWYKCPLGDGDEFYTRLELWTKWLNYSARRIFEDAMVGPIKERWAGATEEERATIVADLQKWREGDTAPWIAHLMSKATPWGVDYLPRDWKARMALLMTKEKVPLYDIVNHLLWKPIPPTT